MNAISNPKLQRSNRIGIRSHVSINTHQNLGYLNMRTTHFLKLALLALNLTFVAGCSKLSNGEVAAAQAETPAETPAETQLETTQDTYLGKLEYQDQTLTRASAAELNRQIDLQRASQLTLWAMPISSFYQSYKASKQNIGFSDVTCPRNFGPRKA